MLKLRMRSAGITRQESIGLSGRVPGQAVGCADQPHARPPRGLCESRRSAAGDAVRRSLSTAETSVFMSAARCAATGVIRSTQYMPRANPNAPRCPRSAVRPDAHCVRAPRLHSTLRDALNSAPTPLRPKPWRIGGSSAGCYTSPSPDVPRADRRVVPTA